MKHYIINNFDGNLLLIDSQKVYDYKEATQRYDKMADNGIKCQLLSFSREEGVQLLKQNI